MSLNKNRKPKGKVSLGWGPDGETQIIVACGEEEKGFTPSELHAIIIERDALNACAEALTLLEAHRADLSKNNPGFMRNLCLDDYGLWNDAELAAARALGRLAAIRPVKTPKTKPI